MSRKIISVILILLLVMGLAACGREFDEREASIVNGPKKVMSESNKKDSADKAVDAAPSQINLILGSGEDIADVADEAESDDTDPVDSEEDAGEDSLAMTNETGVENIPDLFVSANQVGDTIYTPQGFSPKASENYAALISTFGEKCANKNIRLYSMPCPTSSGMLQKYFREMIGSADQSLILDYIPLFTNEYVGNINVFPTLWEHRDEYLYFHGDHHWTALAAYYAYREYCAAADLEAVDLADMEEVDQGPFYGSYRHRAGDPSILADDTVIAYRPIGNYHMTMKDGPNGGTHEANTAVPDFAGRSETSKYCCFIWGDNYFTELTNYDMPEDGPALIVIKDSFGNPVSVYLTQNYRTVYVLDYRKWNQAVLPFAEKHGVKDILICQSIGISQGAGAQSLLASILK